MKHGVLCQGPPVLGGQGQLLSCVLCAAMLLTLALISPYAAPLPCGRCLACEKGLVTCMGKCPDKFIQAVPSTPDPLIFSLSAMVHNMGPAAKNTTSLLTCSSA